MNRSKFIAGAALCAPAWLWIGASLAATCEGLSRHDDYSTPNISEFFHAAVAAKEEL